MLDACEDFRINFLKYLSVLSSHSGLIITLILLSSLLFICILLFRLDWCWESQVMPDEARSYKIGVRCQCLTFTVLGVW